MKPRLLKIKGLNSFAQEETIDFLKLTSKGLFGIFGPTGSGKTSVLDAMTLALYDQVARKTNEFINTDLNSTSVYFEFEIKNGSEKNIYIAERGYKKTENSVKKTTVARLCERKDDKTIDVIAEGSREVNNAVMEIIGLKYDDFTRSVVLPQGKFSEFLTLKGIDRRNMLERIFKLESYGSYLTERIYKRFNFEKENLKKVLAKLEFYNDVNKEMIKASRKELEEFVLEANDVSQKTIDKNKILNDKKNILALGEELNSFEQKLSSVLERKEEIDKKQEFLAVSKKADIIYPFVNNIDGINNDMNVSLDEKQNIDIVFEKVNNESIEIKEKYEIALSIKEEKYETLIKKQEALKQAVLLSEELQNDNSEINILKKRYKDIKQNLDGFINTQNEFLEKKNEIDIEFQKTTITKNENDVDLKYKDFVEKGAEYEENILRLSSEKGEAENKIKVLNENKKEMEEKLSVLNIQIKTENELFLSKENEYTKFLANVPATKEDLLKINDSIGALKNKILRISERDEKVLKLNEKVLSFEKKIEDLKKEAEVYKLKISEKEKVFDEYKTQLEKIERSNLAYELSIQLKENEPCPVCGSTHHPEPARLVLEEMKISFEEKLKTLAEEMEQSERYLKSTEIKIASNESEKSVCMQSLQEEMNVFFGEEKGKNEEELKLLTDKFNLMRKSIDIFEIDKIKKEEELTDLKNNLHNKVSQRDLIDEKIKNILQRLEEGLSLFNNLQEKYIKTNKDFLEHKKLGTINSSFKDELFKIKEKEKLRREAEQKEVELKNIYEKVLEKIKKDSESIQKLEIDLSVTENEGKEKRKIILAKEEKINIITNGQEAKKLLENVVLECRTILENEKSLRNKLDFTLKEREDVLKKKTDILKKIETLSELKNSYEIKLKEALEKNELSKDFNVFEFLLEKEEKLKIENEIYNYNIEKNDAENNIQRLKLKINNVSIKKEEIISLEEEVNFLMKRKEYLTSSIGVTEELIKTLEEKLKVKENLLKEEEVFSHKCSVLGDLAKLVEGNKFVEFISENQLKYITIEASKRLKKITSGRYAIELDGVDFVIRDDFNGGLRRSPLTLSGGEVFLTSFCLALALSTKIQMKNKSPLQFFFLDEGFGTLDNELLDVVMNALENLHDENLSVGIISHVEAIKDRVPVKLIVDKALQGFHGSKVRLEYI